MSTAVIDFRSDNVATVSPEILKALSESNAGTEASYGADSLSDQLDRRFSEVFEGPAKVFPVATGTAANALALSACARPYGGIYCHADAHIHTSEGGATEAFTAGAKLIPLRGQGYRLAADELDAAIARAERGRHHKPQPDAISVTQATEAGTVYRLDELGRIGEIARRHRVRLHMDGARFANAVATLGCSPAEMTWRAGVDILSFGVTKNGGMNAEAIVVFDGDLAEELAYRLRRAGQTWSKMRFAAIQLLAYVEDDLYLRSARQANALASRLGAGIAALPGLRLHAPVEANIVHAILPLSAIAALKGKGVLFFDRGGGLARFVCRFDGSVEDVDRLLATMQACLPAEPDIAQVA